jgi:hypothetical protein
LTISVFGLGAFSGGEADRPVTGKVRPRNVLRSPEAPRLARVARRWVAGSGRNLIAGPVKRSYAVWSGRTLRLLAHPQELLDLVHECAHRTTLRLTARFASGKSRYAVGRVFASGMCSSASLRLSGAPAQEEPAPLATTVTHIPDSARQQIDIAQYMSVGAVRFERLLQAFRICYSRTLPDRF